MIETEAVVSEEQMLTVDPLTIKVREDLPRVRKDLGKIKKMIESFDAFGQLQPVVVNRNMELIAGGRRLAACIMSGRQVKVCFKDEVNPLRMREMELEENIQRKALTPAEEVLAVAEIHSLKVSLYGEAKPGTKVEGQKEWRQEDTAELLGKSRSAVIEDLLLAEAVKNFPSLSAAKTKSEIKSAVKGLQRVNENMGALLKYEETVKHTKEFVLANKDAVHHMKDMPDESVDILLTDPPWGIDIDKQAMTTGGHTGGELTTSGFKYDDSPEYALGLYQELATQSARFTKPTAHAFVFVGPSHFWTVKYMFNEAGWTCSERPIIWIKKGSGQNNNPDAWFSSAYEMILFARKPLAKLVLWGKPDWIQCDGVLPSERTHQAEKPVTLIKELISRTCLPGMYLYDPFMGSGAIVESAVDMKLMALGCELAVESYSTAVARLTKWKEKHTDGKDEHQHTSGSIEG